MIERPTDWTAPAKDFGGENIPELYAQMLVDEVVGMMYAQTRNFDLPIGTGIDQIEAEQKAVTSRLKDRNLYFHKPDGSIFMDYKIMRGEAYRKIGRGMGIEDPEQASVAGYHAVKEQFRPEMSTDEAMQIARGIIESWDWS